MPKKKTVKDWSLESSLVLDAKLEEWKKKNKKNDTDFAKAIGLANRSTVSKYKTGTTPSIDSFSKICEVLGCPASEFIKEKKIWDYENSPALQKRFFNDHLMFSKDIRLSLEFLKMVKEMDGFENDFPLYSDMVQIASHETDDWRVHRIKQFHKAADLKGKERLFQIRHNGNTITLHPCDLLYLKDLQDKVYAFISKQFQQRSKEMDKELEVANASVSDTYNSSDLFADLFTEEKALKANKYLRKLKEYSDKKEGDHD